MNNRLAPVFLIVGSLLTACNGGGGNTGMTPAPVQFTSFSAVQNGQSVPANGFSQTMTIGPFATAWTPSIRPTVLRSSPTSTSARLPP